MVTFNRPWVLVCAFIYNWWIHLANNGRKKKEKCWCESHIVVPHSSDAWPSSNPASRTPTWPIGSCEKRKEACVCWRPDCVYPSMASNKLRVSRHYYTFFTQLWRFFYTKWTWTRCTMIVVKFWRWMTLALLSGFFLYEVYFKIEVNVDKDCMQ